jgi:hypothetical protein
MTTPATREIRAVTDTTGDTYLRGSDVLGFLIGLAEEATDMAAELRTPNAPANDQLRALASLLVADAHRDAAQCLAGAIQEQTG